MRYASLCSGIEAASVAWEPLGWQQLHSGGNGTGAIQDGTSYTLTATDRHAVSDGLQVRRLTPTECERLQGFPDNHTLIPWRGKPAAECPDSPRYKAVGNSMAVPVMRFIGKRIQHEITDSTNP